MITKELSFIIAVVGNRSELKGVIPYPLRLVRLKEARTGTITAIITENRMFRSNHLLKSFKKKSALYLITYELLIHVFPLPVHNQLPRAHGCGCGIYKVVHFRSTSRRRIAASF